MTVRRTATAILGVAAVALAGCAPLTETTVEHGRLGQTLSGPRKLRAELVRYVPHHKPGHDVAGLATPRPGTYFDAVKVKVCGSEDLPVIGSEDFSLALAGGGLASRKDPQSLYEDDEFDLLGDGGCTSGYMVYQVPLGRRASDLRFHTDWSTPRPDGNAITTVVRFDWKL